MLDFIAENTEAVAWVDRLKAEHARNDAFERIAGSVIWSDATGADGRLLVPIDPVTLAAKINAEPFALLNGHDPGFPIGKVLAAAVFTTADSTTFVVAILGFYGGKRLSFHDLGLDAGLTATPPTKLPDLTDAFWINIAVDPREVTLAWLKDVTSTAPMRVKRTDLSHNAVEPFQELIRLGLPYVLLVWNPFVTAFATEVGKGAYAAMHSWFRMLLDKLAECKNPIMEIQAYHDDCQISFIFRGTDTKRHYAAHDALSTAAMQAASLIAKMKDRGLAAKLVVYEFRAEDSEWFPSYAELSDGRLITDNAALIAVESLPSQLSLGVTVGNERVLLPSVKRLS